MIKNVYSTRYSFAESMIKMLFIFMSNENREKANIKCTWNVEDTRGRNLLISVIVFSVKLSVSLDQFDIILIT